MLGRAECDPSPNPLTLGHLVSEYKRGVAFGEMLMKGGTATKQAQETTATAELSTTPWPFDGLSHERWAALTERQKGRVEAAALAELRFIEAKQATASTANRSAA
jgi:hypothetical protein